MQTKWGSFVEAWANIFVGFAFNYSLNLLVLPFIWGPSKHNAAGAAFLIGIVFTLASFVRQYILRRWFNGLKFGNKEVPNAEAQ